MKQFQRGATLILVLGVMAVISILATRMMETSNTALDQYRGLKDRQQALWYARSGEVYALSKIPDFLSQAKLKDEDILARFPFEGGWVEYQLISNHRCFNLNSLGLSVLNEDGSENEALKKQKKHAETAWKQLIDSQTELDTVEQQTLLDRVGDWIDSDSTPSGSYGAEAVFYSSQQPPQQPANKDLLLAEEIMQMEVTEHDKLQALLPSICAHPGSDTLTLNPNDLAPEDAEQLSAILHGKIDVEQAKQLINDRPQDGFKKLSSIWENPIFQNIELSETDKKSLTLTRHFYILKTNVQLSRASFYLLSDLYVSQDKDARVLGRRYGVTQ